MNRDELRALIRWLGALHPDRRAGMFRQLGAAGPTARAYLGLHPDRRPADPARPAGTPGPAVVRRRD